MISTNESKSEQDQVGGKETRCGNSGYLVWDARVFGCGEAAGEVASAVALGTHLRSGT